MRIAGYILVLIVTILITTTAKAQPVTEDARLVARFPDVKASNLVKRELSLPADFEGDRNLLLVAFERDQQKDVDTWLREMRRFEEVSPTFRYYEHGTVTASGLERPFGIRHVAHSRKKCLLATRLATSRLFLDWLSSPCCLCSILVSMADARLAESLANLELLRARAGEIGVEIEQLTVRAPLTGRVLQINIRPGEFVTSTPDVPPILFGETDRLQVRVDVDVFIDLGKE